MQKNGPQKPANCLNQTKIEESPPAFPFPCSFCIFSLNTAKLKPHQHRAVQMCETGAGAGGGGGGGRGWVERQQWCKQQPITWLGDDSLLLARAHVRRQHICCECEEHASAGMLLTAPTCRSHQMWTCVHATWAPTGTASYWKCFYVPITRKFMSHIELVLFKTSMSCKRHINMNVQI